MKKIVISAALTGGRKKTEGEIYRPITPDEIAAEVVACAQAGAAICHIHAHDAAGVGTADFEVWRVIDEKVRKAVKEAGVDVILNYTTSFGTGEARMAHVRAFKPDIASYDSGSINWNNDGMFLNSPELLKNLGDCCIENHVKPEIEIFDANMVKWALRMRDRGHLKEPLWFQLVLGTYGGIDASVENLVFLHSKLPADAKWSASGIGPASVPVLMAALAMGADGIRVGMEDNNYMSKGVPASNVLQVQRAIELVKLANYEVATAADAREILSLSEA